jgi:hypothetical protein
VISPRCGDPGAAERRWLVSRQRPLDGRFVALAGGVAASSWTGQGSGREGALAALQEHRCGVEPHGQRAHAGCAGPADALPISSALPGGSLSDGGQGIRW